VDEQQVYPPLFLIEQIFPVSHLFGGQIKSILHLFIYVSFNLI